MHHDGARGCERGGCESSFAVKQLGDLCKSGSLFFLEEDRLVQRDKGNLTVPVTSPFRASGGTERRGWGRGRLETSGLASSRRAPVIYAIPRSFTCNALNYGCLSLWRIVYTRAQFKSSCLSARINICERRRDDDDDDKARKMKSPHDRSASWSIDRSLVAR